MRIYISWCKLCFDMIMRNIFKKRYQKILKRQGIKFR